MRSIGETRRLVGKSDVEPRPLPRSRPFAPSGQGYRKMRSHEEQQIHDAFIDGFLSGGNGDRLADAELAWTAENTTNLSSSVGVGHGN